MSCLRLKLFSPSYSVFTEALQNSCEGTLTKKLWRIYLHVFVNALLHVFCSTVVLYMPMAFNLNIPQNWLKFNFKFSKFLFNRRNYFCESWKIIIVKSMFTKLDFLISRSRKLTFALGYSKIVSDNNITT